jgi:acetate kinase
MANPIEESPAEILTINGGSSSIRFALFRAGQPLAKLQGGKIERIGLPQSRMIVSDGDGHGVESSAIDAPDHAACVGRISEWLQGRMISGRLGAIGHRIVHGGMEYHRPVQVTETLLDVLRRISPYDPEHLPAEISLIESFFAAHPKVPQVACFDTAFHHHLPRVARLLAIPRRFESRGVRRYGFHGLSYAFLMRELARIGHPHEVEGRIILAHLGNGASMAAVKNGKPIETTMGFTPASGLPMSRRSGDLDPGLVAYLARTEGMTAEQFHHMVNMESGLLGISETSSDIRDLLANARTDTRAAEAIDLFCYQARKWIGALAATLEGVDTVVFSGGIGENAPVIRARICQGLGFLGIALDEASNAGGSAVISPADAAVTVRVMRTDEEREIAEAVLNVLKSDPAGSVADSVD